MRLRVGDDCENDEGRFSRKRWKNFGSKNRIEFV